MTVCVCVDIVHVYMSLCKVVIFMFVKMYGAIPQCVCKIVSSLGVMRPKIWSKTCFIVILHNLGC